MESQRRNELDILAKGKVGHPIIDSHEWDMAIDLAQGKLNDYFTPQERADLKEFLADKLIYMKKAVNLMRTNPDIKKQYRGRPMDLARDLYEKTASKAVEMTLEPTVRELVNTSAAYIGGAQVGQNIANI
jgi:hypothetical protein